MPSKEERKVKDCAEAILRECVVLEQPILFQDARLHFLQQRKKTHDGSSGSYAEHQVWNEAITEVYRRVQAANRNNFCALRPTIRKKQDENVCDLHTRQDGHNPARRLRIHIGDTQVRPYMIVACWQEKTTSVDVKEREQIVLSDISSLKEQQLVTPEENRRAFMQDAKESNNSTSTTQRVALGWRAICLEPPLPSSSAVAPSNRGLSVPAQVELSDLAWCSGEVLCFTGKELETASQAELWEIVHRARYPAFSSSFRSSILQVQQQVNEELGGGAQAVGTHAASSSSIGFNYEGLKPPGVATSRLRHRYANTVSKNANFKDDLKADMIGGKPQTVNATAARCLEASPPSTVKKDAAVPPRKVRIASGGEEKRDTRQSRGNQKSSKDAAKNEKRRREDAISVDDD